MIYGIRVWDANGKSTFDSTLAVGGVVYGAFELSAGQSQTINLTDYPGRTVRVVRYGYVTIGISYSSGYPSVSLNNPTIKGSSLVYIFVI